MVSVRTTTALHALGAAREAVLEPLSKVMRLQVAGSRFDLYATCVTHPLKTGPRISRGFGSMGPVLDGEICREEVAFY